MTCLCVIISAKNSCVKELYTVPYTKIMENYTTIIIKS